MQLLDFDYHLPKSMIAQKPAVKRDLSKLLVLNLNEDSISHFRFHQIENLLEPGDTLVVNDSKVVNARLFGRKITGGKVEVLVLNPHEIKSNSTERSVITECLIKGKVHENSKIELELNSEKGIDIEAKIQRRLSGGRYNVEFRSSEPLLKILDEFGHIPLPPYIKRELKTPNRYQTVYSKKKGSVAAPTAGLHFTPELIKKLENKGVKIAYITLHISYGTFTPVRTNEISKHKMEQEYAILDEKNAMLINQAKASNDGRLVAVGTTTVRTLENIAKANASIKRELEDLKPWQGWTDLFIYPGFKFRAGIDILITNFHLPKSTLLMLVSAFAGRENILKAYQQAIEKKYRFYSLGDAMMIIK